MSTQVFLTATSLSNWTVPADWNNSANTIECIGGGAGGGTYGNGSQGGGGGGGAYSKISNFNISVGTTSIQYGCGVGGNSGSSPTAGGDTFFNGTAVVGSSCGAKGGGVGVLNTSGGVGGASGSGVGTTKSSGGNGAFVAFGSGGGGGGGAAGPNGAGGNASTTNGGTGDNGSGGIGGSGSTPPTAGTEYSSSPAYGSGGGGASALGQSGTQAAASYGAGGANGNNTVANGGGGYQGLIVITYTSLSTNNRYWVGGTANWDASTTTNWAYASGSYPGAPVPVSSNPVFFDNNSTGISTITATANCSNLTCTGFTGTLTGSSALNIYGSLVLVSGMTFSCTGTWTFAATTTQTITTGGKTLPATVFNGIGGAWTFATSSSLVSITLTNGTLSLGSNTITLTGTGTVWSMGATTSNTILIPGTSTIELTNASSSSKTFSGGGNTYYNFYITGSGTGAYTIIGNNTFNNFKVDTPPHTVNFTAGSRTTIASFTVSGTAGNLMTLQSTSAGSPWYIANSSANVVSCDYLSLQDSIAL